MKQNQGNWIKLHRAIQGWEWYGDPNVVLLFVDLLTRATHKPRRFRGTPLNPGDVLYGHADTADRIGISVQSVRTALNKLKSTGEVTTRKTPKGQVISISNWALHQADNRQPNSVLTSEQQATNNYQEGKEGKEDIGGDPTKYAFEGKIIRINQKQFDEWQSNFDAIPDLRAQLVSLDAYYDANLTGKKRENWFIRCSTALGNKHQEFLVKAPTPIVQPMFN